MDGIEPCTLSAGLAEMSDKERKDFKNECGKVDFYERVTCLFLMACNQDGVLADGELENVKASVRYIFNRANIDVDVDYIISNALEIMQTADAYLLDGTVSVFKKYLSKATLKGIVSDCYYMCDADGMDIRESMFLLDLYKRLLG